jgi:hypothetical protein
MPHTGTLTVLPLVILCKFWCTRIPYHNERGNNRRLQAKQRPATLYFCTAKIPFLHIFLHSASKWYFTHRTVQACTVQIAKLWHLFFELLSGYLIFFKRIAMLINNMIDGRATLYNSWWWWWLPANLPLFFTIGPIQAYWRCKAGEKQQQ